MKRTTALALAIIYAFFAVATFGHAYVVFYAEKLPEYKAIKAQGKVVLGSPEEASVYAGFLCGIAWPLYWSVQLARAAKEEGT